MALLKEVSRSFYLTLRVLPGSIRTQIGLAYLLARTTDTIADTELVPLDRRLQALQDLRNRLRGESEAPLDLGELATRQSSPAERTLLEECETNLAMLQTLTPTDLQLVRAALDTITSGQELDLRRFAGASEKNIIALKTDLELDDYTYRVAGCVGEFWTRLCRAHVFPNASLDERELMANGVRFGKGLQLVNILRDLPSDLRTGRCYVPEEKLAASGLAPALLLDPAKEPQFRPPYNGYLDLAEGHLLAGWAYTNALPRNYIRVRLACAWPILIGFETLRRLRSGVVLDAQNRIKVSRGEVRRLMLSSVLLYPFPRVWKNMVKDG